MITGKRSGLYALAAAMLLVAASWIGNILYNSSMQLPGPLFLQHYIETSDSPGAQFELRFLENAASKRKISWIELDGLPYVRVTELQEVRYSHQVVRTMSVQFTEAASSSAGITDNAPLIIHSVHAYFSDGTQNVADIGELRIYHESLAGHRPENAPVEGISSSSSSNNKGSHSFRATREVNITSLESAFLDKLEPWLDLNAEVSDTPAPVSPEEKGGLASRSPSQDGVPLRDLTLPYKLAAGQSMKVAYAFHFPAEGAELAKLATYELRLNMRLQDEQGAVWKRPIFMHYEPYLAESDIRSIVRAGRSLP